EAGYFFIYLSHWSLIFEVVYVVALLYCNVVSVGDLPLQSATKREMPYLLNATLALFALAQPLSFIAMVLYWTVENPIWKLTAETMPDYLGFFAHGLDWVLMTVSLLTGRLPYHCAMSGWVLQFTGLYLVWSGIHFFLRIGTYGGCVRFVQTECPIYNALDWHTPGSALKLVALIQLVIIPATISLYLVMVKLRDKNDPQADLRMMDQNLRELQEMQTRALLAHQVDEEVQEQQQQAHRKSCC
ncbi:unnamed protein product, partial [Polarella glacialis]